MAQCFRCLGELRVVGLSWRHENGEVKCPEDGEERES